MPNPQDVASNKAFPAKERKTKTATHTTAPAPQQVKTPRVVRDEKGKKEEKSEAPKTAKKRIWFGRMLRTTFILITMGVVSALLAIGGGIGLWAYYTPDKLPAVKGFDAGEYNPTRITILTDSTGKVEIAEIYDPGDKETKRPAGRRLFVTPEELQKAPLLVYAYAYAEDSDFFTRQSGFSKQVIKSKIRAGKNDAIILYRVYVKGEEPQKLEGASTITEQVLKMFEGKLDQKIARKVIDLQNADRIERTYDRFQIMWMYANEVPVGPGRYGVGEGARYLFGKKIGELTPAEAAAIVALAKSPEYVKNPEKWRGRRAYVLGRMLEFHQISQHEYDEAIKTPLPEKFHSPDWKVCAEYLEPVKQYLAEQGYTGEKLWKAGLRVRTTCHLPTQQAARKALGEQVSKIDNADGATVCVDPNTRHVTCLVAKGDLNVLATRREPGSSFKPFTWGARFAQGATPDDMVDDSELTEGYQIKGSKPWQPKNHDDKYLGKIIYRQAMAVSSNVAAFHIVTEDLGGDATPIIMIAKQAGGETELKNVLSIAIGTQAVSPLWLANAYATLASGKFGQPVLVQEINGQPIVAEMKDAEIAPEVLGKITNVLKAVNEEEYGTGFNAVYGQLGEWSKQGLVADKTGTTNSSRDAWHAGYTPAQSCVVWIGSRGKSLGKHVYGGNSAAKAWVPAMQAALQGKEITSFPYPVYTTPAPAPAPEQPAAPTAPEAPASPAAPEQPEPAQSPSPQNEGEQAGTNQPQ